MRILHVVESFGAGVGSAVRAFARSMPEIEHHLLYSVRAESPITDSDLEPFASAVAFSPGLVSRMRAVRRRSRDLGAIVHAHSSYGGLYARLALPRGSSRIVYSPHCFAFERLDISGLTRLAYRAVERALAHRTSVIAACSPHETNTAARWIGIDRVVYVPNVSSLGPIHSTTRPLPNRPLRVVMVGRLQPQKDPDFFGAIARRADSSLFEFEWIGGGADEYEAALQASGVRVTGWLDADGLRTELAAADAYVHVAGWEGFPIGVLDAYGAGIPVIVRSTRSVDFLPRELSGADVPEILQRLLELLEPAARKYNVERWGDVLAENTVTHQSSALRAAYSLATQRQDI